ncbi:response regulator transcription factor [Actinoplanes sp. RD1]|uniref:response regulator transcription factor n=1 Tax=Actinoplanes sp. RD1 TaxID=3064538 RepID=UPI002741E64A|nr:response regulator transcription factor [Actinoplanes sp. RD1]
MTAIKREPNVLVVASEPRLRDELATELLRAGYRVATLSTGVAAVRLLAEQPVDLIVVDRDTADLDILGRQHAVFSERPPVLCVTGCEFLGELVPVLGTRVEDYITKPCRSAELLARAEVLVRERGTTGPVDVLRHGDLVLDDVVRRAWRDGRLLEVTPAEYRLLRHMLLNAGRVLSKEQLSRQVWGDARQDATIERLVSRLRQKVDESGSTLIHTHRGFGYRLALAK